MLKVTKDLIDWFARVDAFTIEMRKVRLDLHMNEKAMGVLLQKTKRLLDKYQLGVVNAVDFDSDRRSYVAARLNAISDQLETVRVARPLVFESRLPAHWCHASESQGPWLRNFSGELSDRLLFLILAIKNDEDAGQG